MAFTIDHAEMHKWPKGYWQDNEFYGQRKLLCAWGDMATLAEEVADNPWPETEYGWGTENALARRIRMEPFDAAQLSDSGYYTDYDYGLLICDYWTLGPTYWNTFLITETLVPVAHTVKMDYTQLSWDGPNSPAIQRPGEAPDLTIYGLKYTRKYHGLYTVPSGTMQWIGFTNSNLVWSPTLDVTFGVHTLVYNGARVFAKHKPGQSVYDVEYQFDYKPWDRNKGWRAAAANPQGGLGFPADVYVKNPNGGLLTPFQETEF